MIGTEHIQNIENVNNIFVFVLIILFPKSEYLYFLQKKKNMSIIFWTIFCQTFD